MSGYNNTTTGFNDPEGTHGPHASRTANALDPRVDSDADHRNAPQTGAGATTGSYGAASHTTTGNTGISTHTAPSTTAANTTGGNTGGRIAEQIKGVFAQGHGIGESLRGNINSAIDGLTGDKEKQAHDEEVARGGFREVQNKQFEKRGMDKAL